MGAATFSRPASFIAAAMAVGFMSAEPTICSALSSSLTVLRALMLMTSAPMPNAIMSTPATMPPISRILRPVIAPTSRLTALSHSERWDWSQSPRLALRGHRGKPLHCDYGNPPSLRGQLLSRWYARRSDDSRPRRDPRRRSSRSSTPSCTSPSPSSTWCATSSSTTTARVEVTIALTVAGCPMRSSFEDQVQRFVGCRRGCDVGPAPLRRDEPRREGGAVVAAARRAAREDDLARPDDARPRDRVRQGRRRQVDADREPRCRARRARASASACSTPTSTATRSRTCSACSSGRSSSTR